MAADDDASRFAPNVGTSSKTSWSLKGWKHLVFESSAHSLSQLRRRVLVVLSMGNPEIYAENSLCSEEGTLFLHQQNKSKRSAGLQRGVDLHVWGHKYISQRQWHEALMHYQKALKVLIKYYGTNDHLMVAK
jgi:hypothetical protein